MEGPSDFGHRILPCSVVHFVKSRSFGGMAVSTANTAAVEKAHSMHPRIYFLVKEQRAQHLSLARQRGIWARCTTPLGLAAAVARARLGGSKRKIFNIHSGTSTIPKIVQQLRVAIGPNIPMVVTLHGPSEIYPIRDDNARREQMRLAACPDSIVVPSDFERETQLDRGLSANQVFAVPDIAHIARGDRPAFRQRHGLDHAEFVIGFCGRLADEKGILETVESFPEIRQQCPGATLVVAGVGPRERDARALSERLGIGVRFLGQVDRMGDFYAGVDLVVAPSRGESFGFIAVEAALCETPLVVSAIRPWTDWLRPGVDCEMIGEIDGSAIAEAVLRLSGDPEARRKMARSAKQRAAQRFSPNAAFECLVGAYAAARTRREAHRNPMDSI